MPDAVWSGVARAAELRAAGDVRGALAVYTALLAGVGAAGGGDPYLLFQLHWGCAGLLEDTGDEGGAAANYRASAALCGRMYATLPSGRVARHGLREKHAVVLDRLGALAWADFDAARAHLDEAVARAGEAVGTAASARGFVRAAVGRAGGARGDCMPAGILNNRGVVHTRLRLLGC